MARKFFATATDKMFNLTPGVNLTEPFTVAVRFMRTVTASGAIQSLWNNIGTATSYYWMYCAASGPIGVARQTATIGAAGVPTTTSYTANTWNWAAAAFSASNVRNVYLNNAGKATSTTSFVATTATRWMVGHVQSLGTATQLFTGAIAEIAIWATKALTTDEMAPLATNNSAAFVRPDILTYHWHIIGENATEIGHCGGIDLTTSGTVATDHPPTLFKWQALHSHHGEKVSLYTAAASAVGVAGLQRNHFINSLAATAAGVADLVRLIYKNLAATAVGVATVVAQVVKLLSFAATAVGVASLQRVMQINNALTAVGVAALQRLIFKNLAVVAVGVATVAAQVVKLLAFAATAVGVAALQRTIQINRALTATGVVDLQRLIFKNLAVVATGVAAVVVTFIPFVVAATTAAVTHVAKFIGNIGHMMGRR